MALGHEVVLFGGTRGFDVVPERIDGIPTRLFAVKQSLPRSGFAGLNSGGLRQELERSAQDFDLAHIHAARDFVTLPAALQIKRQGIPYFMQTHGMIQPSRHPLSVPLDLFWTRPLLKAARNVFVLTSNEHEQLSSVVPEAGIRMKMLANGVPLARSRETSHEKPLEVLFLARLQKRKQPQLFVEAAIRLSAHFPDVKFSLVGPDEGEAAEVARAIRTAGLESNIRWLGPIAMNEAQSRLADCDIYVLPSIDEPFPMSVLEAMSVGRPVIVSNTCGLAPAVSASGAGIVINPSIDALEVAIAGLLRDESLRVTMGALGRHLVRSQYSMEAVAKELVTAYESAA